MKHWTTKIRAIDPIDGISKLWVGPIVPGESSQEAHIYCQQTGLGYCQIDGEFVMSINHEHDLNLN